MNYTELSIQLKESPVLRELLVFKLAEFGFESFQDLDGELKAFVLAKEFKMESVDLVKSICKADLIKVAIIEHKAQNWNQQWEANFSPIMVNDNCVIRTSFHDIKAVKYDVIIDPAMTFGTGHHETTQLIIESLLDNINTNDRVLDLGSGSGILSIAALKFGASEIMAIEYDEDCKDNFYENMSLNNINEKYTLSIQDVLIYEDYDYDLIIANINKNVLVDLLPNIKHFQKNKCKIILSGLLIDDQEDMMKVISKLNYNIIKQTQMGEWICIVLD